MLTNELNLFQKNSDTHAPPSPHGNYFRYRMMHVQGDREALEWLMGGEGAVGDQIIENKQGLTHCCHSCLWNSKLTV